jgi:hypothetical protein
MSNAIRHYDLTTSYIDRLSGIAIEPLGGDNRSAQGYAFTTAGGLKLRLQNAIEMDRYSLLIDFQISLVLTAASGYHKLLDFGNLVDDTGVYVYGERISLYDVEPSPDVESLSTSKILADTPMRLVLVRDPGNSDLRIYINGQLYVRSSSDLFALPSNAIAHLFQDDTSTGNEASVGICTQIVVFSEALSASRIEQLNNELPIIPYPPRVMIPPDQIKADMIAALNSALAETYTGDPLDGNTRHIIDQLDRTIGSLDVAAAGANSGAADVSAGIDASLDIEAIKSSSTAILAKLSADPATQTTLAAVLAALNTGTTHTDLAGLQTTLNAILAEARDDVFVQSTVWEDRSSVVAVFYREERVRSQDDGSVATIYTRLSDNTIVGSMPAGVIPVQGAADRTIEFYRWRLKNAGTGYSAGDWITNTIVFDTDGNGGVLSSNWYNLTTSATIAAPLPTDLEDPNDRLLNLLGAQSDSAATSDTGTFSLFALIKRGLTNWTSLLDRLPAALVGGRLSVDGSGVTQPISVAALPLPSGAATQTTLASIDNKVPALGQALASASVPVVLTAAQISTLTPPSNTGYALDTSINNLLKPSSTLAGVTTIGSITNALPTGANTIGSIANTSFGIAGSLPAFATTPTVNLGTIGSVATETTLATLVLQGAVVTGETLPSGSGFLGWISSIRGRLDALTAKFTNGSQLLSAALSVAQPRKLTVPGFTSTAAINSNLLDGAGTALITDVRDYNSAELTIVSTATTGSYVVQAATDAAGATATILQLFESTTQNANPINGAITPTNSTRKFQLNLAGVNYLRVNLTTATAGVTPTLVLSQNPFVPNQVNIVQTAAANLQATAAIAAGQTLATVTTVGTVSSDQLAAQSAAIVDVASASITTTANTAAFTPTWGISQLFSIVVTAFSGTAPTLDITVQESPDAGVTWRDVYTFATIIATGTYTSPLVAQAGRQYRYVQTVAGTTPSFTRAINRYQSNVPIAPYSGAARLGAVNNPSADILIGSRFIRRLYAANTTATQLFVLFFNKAGALTTGDIPIGGEIYALAAVSGVNAGLVILSPSDLPQIGLNYGANMRVGISTTRFTYTAATTAGVSLNIEVTA